MAGTNFHLEHHLYPRVPCWRLPALHRWLKEQGVYEGRQVFIEPAYIASWGVQHSNMETMLGEPA